jgi:flagellin
LTGAFVSEGAAYSADFSFASVTSSDAKELKDVGTSFFTKALENIATLRAENGGSTSRLNFSLEHISRSQANLEAANGRIVDTDIAAESTQLAKYNILVQASASMLSQANVSPQTALMLLG